MARALRLASLSLGMTWPNPGVGCILVRDGLVLGEGRHRRCGELHGETSALADCRARGNDPAGATAYVTLAPCTRQGRQPPCVQALIAARVARVVAAVADPHQDDAGAILRAAGIAYDSGCLEGLAVDVHGGFLMRIRRGRPRLTGKWAMSRDGFIAPPDRRRIAISSPEAMAWMRRRRRAFDAVLVGAGTVRHDDPELLCPQARDHGGEPGPLRIVVSAGASLDPAGRLALDAQRVPVLVVHDVRAGRARLEALRARGVRLLAVADAHDAGAVAQALGVLGLNEVLVEGGAAVHAAFLAAGLYDRLEVQVGEAALGSGLAAPDISGWRREGALRMIAGTRIGYYRRD